MEQVNEPIASSANDPWVSLYPNLTKDEFLTMILMAASKTRYQLGFFILILYILSKMTGAIIIVKTIKNAKLV